MIKRVKNLKPSGLLSQDTYRDYIASFESETNRGIATLVILKIIKNNSENGIGIYGYKILQELEAETKNMLVIEQGRLYPMLRKLEKEKLVRSKSITKEGSRRARNYYSITEEGNMIFHHLKGVFFKLLQSIEGLMEFKLTLNLENTIFCPNCSNLIQILDDINYCEICGNNIIDLKEAVIKNSK
jgi:PadR family transcriptional regulator PadR